MPSSLLCLCPSYLPYHHCCAFAYVTFHTIIAVSLHKLPSMPSSLRVTTLQPSSHPSPYTNRTPNASYGHAHLLSLNPLNTGAAISAIAVWTAAMPTSIPFCHIRTCLHPYPSDHKATRNLTQAFICIHKSVTRKAGEDRIYTPYMTVHL